jgi:hypothetical protein
MAIKGSCHCGAVRYSLDDDPTQAIECNCSICRRKGSILAFSPREKLVVETPREAIEVYTFNSHNIRHQFCKTCGCAPFSEATAPDGTPMAAINLRCVEDFDLAGVTISPFDGASR